MPGIRASHLGEIKYARYRSMGAAQSTPDAGPAGKVQHLFETCGYDQQGSYNNEVMLLLTLRLIVRIVQGLPG